MVGSWECRTDGENQVNGAFLRGFDDDEWEHLIAGIAERLTSHGIKDLVSGEIMISGPTFRPRR